MRIKRSRKSGRTVHQDQPGIDPKIIQYLFRLFPVTCREEISSLEPKKGCKVGNTRGNLRNAFAFRPASYTVDLLKVVKRLKETGCVTSRPQVRRPRNVGRKVQPEDVLAYAHAHPQSSTKMISENCGLSEGHVWTILNESGAHPYRSTPAKGLMLRNVTRGATL
ncbi:hypothetical protein AVEN_26212-1 [Araneus ventricosus]|uniref:DUF4817 domain-containing protein n=1 Tax=Araneus ventricosus TaxID=182803 RepID=A0A4Y2ALY1_ARAVE|nr:hypothetical protein AVEN_26212-1 [Araneus ventricosus]